MGTTGVDLRLGRIGTNGRYLVVPMDHGITIGPADGLVDIADTARSVLAGGADAVLGHRGTVRRFVPVVDGEGVVVHLNASTTLGPDQNDKRQVCSVASAVATGADAVSFHINVGSKTEPDQLAELGAVVERAHEFGLPVLAMAYPRGPGVDPNDPASVAHAVRVAAELDADLIKTSYPSTGFDAAVTATDRPVLVAGGSPDDPRSTIELVAEAMAAGAAGVSIGRSIFQHPDPAAMTAAIRGLVHDDDSVPAAMDVLERRATTR